MPSIVYERCKQIVQLCKENGYYSEINLSILKQLIAEHIGGDPRTLKLYLSRLCYFGLMKPVNQSTYKIEPKTVNKEVSREQQETLDKAILKQWGIKI